MYIGREDFEATEWHEAQREAKRNLSPNLTDYLFAKPYLADYLEKGLSLLGYSCEDTE
ncbi:MAG TPA: DUF3775 domain-containing protein [Gammaproteobacteria bacterium]|nr:DUF3775 domain-containing protein [Gammaproteobacteria bacterium]